MAIESDKRRSNPRKYRKIQLGYRQRNKTKIKAWRDEYNRSNAERVRANKQKYIKNNKDRVNESKRKWIAANPLKYKAIRAALQEKRRALLIKATIGDLNEIREFYKYVHTCDVIACAYCSKDVPLGKRHVDHKIPLSRGGSHSLPNLTAACSFCNVSKHNKTVEEFLARGRQK